MLSFIPKLFNLTCLVLVFSATGILNAQNLETIGKEKPIKISGGASVSQIFYGVNGIESRRQPYSYFASGSVNFSLYGWNVPLSFSLSNQNVSFQQPFNQFSLNPTYKWVTAHLGFTSMTFSPYTLSGHLFNGVGVDLTPTSKLKVSALYGRFLKGVEADTSNAAAQPAYQRMCYGVKVYYGDSKNFANVIVFSAKDQLNSISPIPDSLGVLPEDNLVISIGGGKTIIKNLTLQAELATSAITRDLRATEAAHDHPLAKMNFLYTPRISSAYYNALKGSLAYQFSNYAIGLGYERIDPQYRTLGAYFFNNDLENITINAATALAQGKVNVAANVGRQRDNLDKSKISTMERSVGALNVAFAPSQRLNMSLSYSNFQSFTNIRSQFVDINQLTPFDNLDTLNFTQISQNATVNAMYMFGANENKKQSLSVNLVMQDAADKQGEVTQNSGVQFYNMNAAYSVNLVPSQTTLSTSFNASINSGADIDSKTLGPSLSASRTFFEKKLRTNLSLSANNSYTNNRLLSTIMNARVSGTISVQKKHNINVSMVVVNRNNRIEGGAKSFTEFTGTVGYSYSFGN